jgi:glycosyltransferase involved in cell wall biosynthesis
MDVVLLKRSVKKIDLNFPKAPESLEKWPWRTTEFPAFDDYQKPEKWPRITIVTPSYNQSHFLEATIRSVLLQGYPNLEYIIIDGGSTDDSVEIIQKYDGWINWWVSEPDRGQSHAINKGFAKATGRIFAWLNSDDMYAPQALWKVASEFRKKRCSVLTGHSMFVDEFGHFENRFHSSPVDLRSLLRIRGGFTAPQQSTFWTKSCWGRHGPLSEDLHLVMDYDFWIKMAAAREKWCFIDEDLALYRHHKSQKTANIPVNLEMNMEKRLVLGRFSRSSLCRIEMQRDIRRGFIELDVKDLRILFQKSQQRKNFFAYWLEAGKRNPNCFRIPAFYGLLFKHYGGKNPFFFILHRNLKF